MHNAFTAPYHGPLKSLEAEKSHSASLGSLPMAAVAVMQILQFSNSRKNALSVTRLLDRITRVMKGFKR